MAKANRRAMVFAQIETDEGVRNAAEIAAVPGVSGLLVGPNDLSIDYGMPGEAFGDTMEHAYARVIQAAQAAGKPSGIITGNTRLIKFCEEQGMRIFSCNSEVGLLAKQIKATVAELKA